MDFKQEIFKGKDFSGLLKDIYGNRKKKDEQIKILINELRPLVKTMNDATLLVPLLKDYIEIGVKNDEHLVKMAAIVQRALAKTADQGPDFDFKLTEEEKQELIDAYKESEEDKPIKDTKTKFDDIIKENE